MKFQGRGGGGGKEGRGKESGGEGRGDKKEGPSTYFYNFNKLISF